MEAADTICYRVIDAEDSFKLKMLNFQIVKKHLIDICKETPIQEDLYKEREFANLNDTDTLAYLRAKAISSLIYQAYNVWENKYELIMSGEYNNELLEDSRSNQ